MRYQYRYYFHNAQQAYDWSETMEYIIEMCNITKEFPGIIANDDITLQLKKGEIHALLGENGAGKSTLMSVLFGMYQPEKGCIKMNGEVVSINNPNDANRLGIGMVHQHFKLVHNFTVLENIILGAEDVKNGLLTMVEARKKVVDLSEKYHLIFDEPTAVLTPQEIDELMGIMKDLTKEGKSILFITHKLNEIKAVADRCSVLRKGKYIGTIDVKDTSKEEMSEMMVGRKVNFNVEKKPAQPKNVMLDVRNLSVAKKGHQDVVKNVSFQVHEGEIVCVAGIDGNGQSELVYALSGLMDAKEGSIRLGDMDITKTSIRKRNLAGLGHIPEDRHRYGLVLDYPLSFNMVLKSYFTKKFSNHGFLKFADITRYSDQLIEKYDVRSGQGSKTSARSMSGGNQQKAIIAREIENDPKLLLAVQPTRGLDVGAIEYIHSQLVKERDEGRAILLISLELDEVMNLADRILVMYEGEIVAELNPETTTIQELGLYMAGSKRGAEYEKAITE